MKVTYTFTSENRFYQQSSQTEAHASSHTEGLVDPDYKMSWFEEKVETFMSHSCMSNYHCYGFRRNPFYNKENFQEIVNQIKNKEDVSCKNDTGEPYNDLFSQLLNTGPNKLQGCGDVLKKSKLDNIYSALPCKVVPELTKSKKVEIKNLDESFYNSDSCRTCIKNSGLPLSELADFIQNTLDSSLSKFRDEINKAIDSKFESLKTFSLSESSDLLSLVNQPSSAQNNISFIFDMSVSDVSTLLNIACGTIGSQDPGLSNFVDLFPNENGNKEILTDAYIALGENKCISSSMEELTTDPIMNFNLENIQEFQSQSVNIINKTKDIIGNGDSFNEQEDNAEINASNNGADDMTVIKQPSNQDTLLECPIFDKEVSSSSCSQNIYPDSCSNTVKDMNTNSEENKNSDMVSSFSRNILAEIAKKKANPKLLTDMTKCMYIIFESFKKLNGENAAKEVDISSNESDSSFKCSKINLNNKINKEDKNDNQKESAVNNLTASPNQSQDGINNIGLHGFCKEEDKQAVVAQISHCEVEAVPAISTCQENLDPIHETSEKLDNDESKDCGYTIQRFIKDSSIATKLESNEVLHDLKEEYLRSTFTLVNEIPDANLNDDYDDKYKCQIRKKFLPVENLLGSKLDSKFYCNVISKQVSGSLEEKVNEDLVVFTREKKNRSNNLVSIRHSLVRSYRSQFKNSNKKTEVSLDSTIISLLDISIKNRYSWVKKISHLSNISDAEEEKDEGKGNLLKRLCFIRRNRGDNLLDKIDRHLDNIYNAICLDFVTKDVYKSVQYISKHLRHSNSKTKQEIMRRWVKICNKSVKGKKSFNLECLHQFWIQFRTKICHIPRPPQTIPPGYLPAITYLSEEHRLIKEQVIQKYAEDILEYISNPKIFKNINVI